MSNSTALTERDSSKVDLAIASEIGGTDISAAQGRSAFMPTSMGQAMEIAKLMAGSNFVPKHLRGKPGDCLAVIMQSARWAMDPFAVGNKTYFVNDRMAYEAQLVNAVVNSSNVLEGRLKVEWSGEGNNLECTVTGRIKGDPDPKTRRVKLNTITTRNSPLWKQDPEQQLAYFTQRAWARLHTPEVLLGVYTPDEIESIEVRGAGSMGGEQSQRISSQMLAQQAGETIDQPERDPEVEKGRAAMSEDAQQTLQDIDGPLNDEPEEGQGERIEDASFEEADVGEPEAEAEASDPMQAKADEIIKGIDDCKTIVALRAHRERSDPHIQAMSEEMAATVKLQFKTMSEALKRNGGNQ